MAHKNVDYKPEDIQFPNQKIVQSELVHEMQSSYIEYAMSVIVGRALPDVRDGLKPARRRVGVRRARASRAGLLHALYARRRPRQLRFH